MRYEDFILHLEAGPGDGYTVRVSSPLAGEAEGCFQVPVDLAEIEGLTEDVLRAVARRSSRQLGLVDGDGPVESSEKLLRSLGGRLFGALFQEGVRSRLDRGLGRLDRQSGLGLRLKLQMGLDDRRVARLHALPWEYLYRTEDRAFLGLSRQTPIVRYLSLPLPADRPPLPLPLRVLAVVSAPQGLPFLHLERELEDLATACRAREGLDLEILRHPTLDSLREVLLSGPVHVLHFMGHGDFEPDYDEGVLFLEDGQGGPLRVGGEALARQLRDIQSLRLVVLNACRTAQAAVGGPFAGVATALLQAGVPAVIAMQLPVSDAAALAFGETLYRRLAAGDPVDAAVAEGRLAIVRRLPGSMEWGTPVLFLRAQDGVLFETAGAEPISPPAAEDGPALRVSPRRWLRRAAAGLIVAAGAGLVPELMREEPPRGVVSEQTAAVQRPGSAPEAGAGSGEAALKTRSSPGEIAASQKPDPGPLQKPEPEQTVQTRPEKLRPEAPATPSAYSLADGETVWAPEIDATLGITFVEEYGVPFVRVSLTPKTGGLPPQATMGGALTFGSAPDRTLVHVTAIDWERRTAQLLPRRAGSRLGG